LVFAIEANGFAYAIQTCGGRQQNPPSWGLARVSHDGSVAGGIDLDYRYTGAQSGAGVDVYVIDTGILETHDDFGGRAKWGIDIVDNNNIDGNGHGTHCAGTVGGTRYGVAKSANLIAVKVLDALGSGSWEDVVAGVNYVGTNARVGFSVASMSLGGSGSNTALTNAINSCVSKGIPVVVASGNSNADACRSTPSGILSTICVNSMEISGSSPNEFDLRSSFSNYGTCTDIFAPGRAITSAWIGSNSASKEISGTSMACPHVAGYVAGLLSEDSSRTPDDVLALLQEHGQYDLISNPGAGSPNLLLHNLCKS